MALPLTLKLRPDAPRMANLRSLIEANGKEAVLGALCEALEKRTLRPEHFNLQELAEAVWPAWKQSCDPRSMAGGMFGSPSLTGLSEDAIDSTMFANITGQIVFTKVMEGFMEADEGVFERICTVIPTKFNGEKIPGISPPTADGYEIAEGAEYDQGQVIEDYIETPVTTKRGQIIYVTKEAVFFDRTNMLLQQAGKVGERLATKRLKLMIDVVCGATNPFKWRGTSKNTYQSSLGDWINSLSSNALVDWTDIDAVYVLAAKMTDPNTSEPISISLPDVLVPPHLAATAKRILNATQITFGDGASNTSQTVASNPVADLGRNIIVSSQLYARLVAAGDSASVAGSTWFIGDFKKAFAYMENWGLTPASLPAGSTLEFTRDVVAGFKFSERGVPTVIEPRRTFKCPGA